MREIGSLIATSSARPRADGQKVVAHGGEERDAARRTIGKLSGGPELPAIQEAGTDSEPVQRDDSQPGFGGERMHLRQRKLRMLLAPPAAPLNREMTEAAAVAVVVEDEDAARIREARRQRLHRTAAKLRLRVE